MNRFLRSIFSKYFVSSLLAAACTTREDGSLMPLLTNPEVAIPTAIANKVTGRDRIYLIKGEIIQDQKCFRPYPMSRLMIKIKRADSANGISFYPSDRIFQKELFLDSRYPYLIELDYEPTNVILAEQKVVASEPLNVLLKIHCDS
jgi:hypothetical protein